MIFRYVRIKVPGGELVRVPAIPISLTCNKRYQDIYALIDSGAEVSVFNAAIARTLNIDIERGKYLSLKGFIGADVDSYLHQINVSIQGLGSADFLFAVTNTKEPQMPILGQRGFFDRFQIRFERYKDLMELYPRSTTF